MLFLDGVYAECSDGSLHFRWVKAPSSAELDRLAQTPAQRIGRCLERQGLLERDAENSHLAGDGLEAGPMDQLLGSSITYRIAFGPQQGPAKCSRCRRCPRVRSRLMPGSVRTPDLHYTPAWRRGRINARSSNGCAAISAGRPSRKNACRIRRTARSDTT